jgi:UDPglucose--hexose-1-phosphate uridylyltransferase
MYRTDISLADGRVLSFYDRDSIDRSRLKDLRKLDPKPAAGELRCDPVYGDWVSLASHRQERAYLPPAELCPLCPSVGNFLTEIPDSNYDIAVFENLSPAFSRDDERMHPSMLGGLVDVRPGVGRCEVICFRSDHTASFTDLPVDRVRDIVDVWIDRTRELSRVSGIVEVFPFENRGVEIGVTLHHPHGQIYGYPFITPKTAASISSAVSHHRSTGGDLFADLLAGEIQDGRRIIVAGQYWTAFVPAWARWPFEIHIYPNRHIADFTEVKSEEADELAQVYLTVLNKLDRVFDLRMPYIAGWHQAPVKEARDLVRLRCEIFSVRRAPGKLKYLAGSESAMGAFILDVTPEQSAEMLRRVL